jgi:hypothetical protein
MCSDAYQRDQVQSLDYHHNGDESWRRHTLKRRHCGSVQRFIMIKSTINDQSSPNYRRKLNSVFVR